MLVLHALKKAILSRDLKLKLNMYVCDVDSEFKNKQRLRQRYFGKDHEENVMLIKQRVHGAEEYLWINEF